MKSCNECGVINNNVSKSGKCRICYNEHQKKYYAKNRTHKLKVKNLNRKLRKEKTRLKIVNYLNDNVLCSNCHRIKTAYQFNYYKIDQVK
tara:strand:+ start:23780 stop:24049 length:270 start_codon:yes stop_codon:yes gene_type:complete